MVMGCWGFSQAVAPPIARPKGPPTSPSSLPSGVQADRGSQVQADFHKEEYDITWKDNTPLPDIKAADQAANRTQGFRTYFTEDGIRVVPQADEEPSWTWELTLVPGPEARISNLESLRNREFK